MSIGIGYVLACAPVVVGNRELHEDVIVDARNFEALVSVSAVVDYSTNLIFAHECAIEPALVANGSGWECTLSPSVWIAPEDVGIVGIRIELEVIRPIGVAVVVHEHGDCLHVGGVLAVGSHINVARLEGVLAKVCTWIVVEVVVMSSLEISDVSTLVLRAREHEEQASGNLVKVLLVPGLATVGLGLAELLATIVK